MVNQAQWTQCEGRDFRKWRMLPTGVNPDDLPEPWFYHTEPFNGNYQMPEEDEMPAKSVTVGCDKPAVPCTTAGEQNHNMGVESCTFKAHPKHTKLLQKSITNFFPRIEFDEAIQALRFTALSNNDATQGMNSATTVVNIVTAGFSRRRGRPRKV